MKKKILACSLAFTCLFSTQLWSLGSAVDLGTFVVSPGAKMNINADETPIFAGIEYVIECTMQPVADETTIAVYTDNGNISLTCKDNPAYYYQVCTIPAKNSPKTVFKRVIKDSKYVVSIKNFDQNLNLTFHCQAKPMPHA